MSYDRVWYDKIYVFALLVFDTIEYANKKQKFLQKKVRSKRK